MALVNKSGVILLVVSILGILAIGGLSRHNVGDEKNNPAPSSHLMLDEGQALGAEWMLKDTTRRRWSTPAATSSMVPYLDSHSVLLLHVVVGPVRLHDILIVDEGPGLENVVHQVVKVSGNYVYLAGKNNKWPDGWMPLSAVKWRVVAIVYTQG